MVGLEKYNISPEVGAGNFDWDMYEDGWNGRSLKTNKSVKTKKGHGNEKVFSHERYAQKLYNKMTGLPAPVSKEVAKNSLVKITDLALMNNKNTVMATINNGASNIIIDLEKEGRFFNTISLGEERLNKESFIECIKNPEIKQDILSLDLCAKIGTDTAKASIWDGYVANLTNEMKRQATANTKAYTATILSTNKGGFVVEVNDIIKAFMPGSMAASNRVTDYESLVGQKMEVMVESYDPVIGFVVSRKKYLRTILPKMLQNMTATLKKNQDTVFTGHVTGSTQFGVFVEIDEFITGMLHKSLVSDATREAMRLGTIEPGTEVNVYVHKIENNRVILSDVPSTERDEVIAKREAEDESEKAARAAMLKASENAEM